ncbi:MAG: MmgE/PrpD family protein, partial [Pseudomonadota bacterium]
MIPAGDAFIAHAQSTTYADLPADAQTATKTFLLDTLGVGIAGAAAPLTTNVRQAASSWGHGGGAHLLGPRSPAVSPDTA